MKTRLFSILGILAMASILSTVMLSSGCARLSALARADAIEKEARVERFRFLEKLSYAYWLVGDEYFRLAIEAEDNGDEKKANEYSIKAELYLTFSKGIKRDLEELRAQARSPLSTYNGAELGGGV